jgi:1-propanol dehydrogenase
MKEFFLKTRVYSGGDALNRLSEFQDKKIFIACDKFLYDNGSLKKLLLLLSDSNKVTLFIDIAPDAPAKTIVDGTDLYIKNKSDIIIAFGGGSAIDTAKAILMGAKKFGIIKSGEVKLIAIPTTSGSGSEATAVTVLSNPDEGIKRIIHDYDILPDEAILDSSLTVSAAPQLTAFTGIDVIAHAAEAYVATGDCVYSDAFAEKAIELVSKSLLECYFNGTNEDARLDMSYASNLAGMAFNQAGLGLCHAIAHAMGGKFYIPHGLSNALLLNEVVWHNSKDPRIKEKYADLARKSGLVNKDTPTHDAVKGFTDFIANLRVTMKMKMTISECGISRQDFDAGRRFVADQAMNDICMNTNPVEITAEGMEDILNRIY